jgi:hypothetical protein
MKWQGPSAKCQRSSKATHASDVRGGDFAARGGHRLRLPGAAVVAWWQRGCFSPPVHHHLQALRVAKSDLVGLAGAGWVQCVRDQPIERQRAALHQRGHRQQVVLFPARRDANGRLAHERGRECKAQVLLVEAREHHLTTGVRREIRLFKIEASPLTSQIEVWFLCGSSSGWITARTTVPTVS